MLSGLIRIWRMMMIALQKPIQKQFLIIIFGLICIFSSSQVGCIYSFVLQPAMTHVPYITREDHTYCTGHRGTEQQQEQQIAPKCWGLSRISLLQRQQSAKTSSSSLSSSSSSSETTTADGVDVGVGIRADMDNVNGVVVGDVNGTAFNDVNGAHDGQSISIIREKSNGVYAQSSTESKEESSLLDLELEEDVPKPTANGGFSHTRASRAKIGAANKGKTPWNKGRAQSEEVRARIAAGVRKKNRERFLKKLQDMGLTEEEYAAQKKAERNRKDAERRARRTEKGGYRPTDETRAKISRILKEKFAKGEIKPRKTDPSKVRKGFTHTEETRAKISASLRKRWAEDPEYRENMAKATKSSSSSTETRQRISETLKKRWEDPNFRSHMMSKISTRKSSTGPHDEAHRAKISAAMKAKWQDAAYREKTLSSIANRRGPIRPKPKSRVRPSSSRSTAKKKNPAPDARLVQPMASAEPKTKRRKNKIRISSGTRTRKKDDNSSSATEKKNVAPAKKVEPKTVVKSQPPEETDPEPDVEVEKKPKEKEPDGSVNRLKRERRDLFDLLYGDEDYERSMIEEGEVPRTSTALHSMMDTNLDEYDPYGLDNY